MRVEYQRDSLNFTVNMAAHTHTHTHARTRTRTHTHVRTRARARQCEHALKKQGSPHAISALTPSNFQLVAERSRCYPLAVASLRWLFAQLPASCGNTFGFHLWVLQSCFCSHCVSHGGLFGCARTYAFVYAPISASLCRFLPFDSADCFHPCTRSQWISSSSNCVCGFFDWHHKRGATT